MSLKNSNLQSGRAVLRVVIVIAIVVVVVYGAYKVIPWAWHGWPTLATAIRTFWQIRIAHPILRAMIQVLVVTGGHPLAALATIALANWLVFRINALFTAISTRGMIKANRQTQAVEETIIGQMENVQDTLKKVFADDLEKIALFGGRIGSGKTDRASSNPSYAGCAAYIPGLIWMWIAGPLMFIIGLAVYDGLLRLFVTSEPLDSLVASAGSHAGQLKTLFPVQQTVSLAGVFIVNLADRSMVLTAILFAVGLISWFVGSISKSGLTVPRLTSFYPLLLYIVMTVCCYFFLNGAILIFAISWVIYSFIYLMVAKFLTRPLYLRTMAALSSRASLDDGVQDPARAAA